MTEHHTDEQPPQKAGLSPSSVAAQEFPRVTFGGYDRTEVRDYLRELAQNMEEWVKADEARRATLAELEKRMDTFSNLEKTMLEAVAEAQNLTADIVSNARKEGEAIIAQAQAEAARLVQANREIPEETLNQIERLRQQHARLEQDLRAVLETHLRLLDARNLGRRDLIDTPSDAPILSEAVAGTQSLRSAIREASEFSADLEHLNLSEDELEVDTPLEGVPGPFMVRAPSDRSFAKPPSTSPCEDDSAETRKDPDE